MGLFKKRSSIAKQIYQKEYEKEMVKVRKKKGRAKIAAVRRRARMDAREKTKDFGERLQGFAFKTRRYATKVDRYANKYQKRRKRKKDFLDDLGI